MFAILRTKIQILLTIVFLLFDQISSGFKQYKYDMIRIYLCVLNIADEVVYPAYVSYNQLGNCQQTGSQKKIETQDQLVCTYHALLPQL